jgi:hypothetical protein
MIRNRKILGKATTIVAIIMIIGLVMILFAPGFLY